MTRTQDEIVARIADVEAEDWFGFRREVLIEYLDYQHAKPYLKPEVTGEEQAGQTTRLGSVEAEAKHYLEFAIGKIENHRGISANRSVDKLGEYAWLLSRADVLAAMDAADYEQYGAPKVKAFALGMGWPWPADVVGLNRMADGEPCVGGCEDGCNR